MNNILSKSKSYQFTVKVLPLALIVMMCWFQWQYHLLHPQTKHFWPKNYLNPSTVLISIFILLQQYSLQLWNSVVCLPIELVRRPQYAVMTHNRGQCVLVKDPIHSPRLCDSLFYYMTSDVTAQNISGGWKIATHWDAWPSWTRHTLEASCLFKGPLLVYCMVCVSAAQIRFVPLVNFGLWPGCKQGEEKARWRKGRGEKRLDYDSVSLCELVQSCDSDNNGALVQLNTVPDHHERQMRLSQAYCGTYFHFLESFDQLCSWLEARREKYKSVTLALLDYLQLKMYCLCTV